MWRAVSMRSARQRLPGPRVEWRQPSTGSARPEQHGGGEPGRSGDHVHAVVHPVDPVDVGVAGGAEHHRGPRRRPEAGVGGPVGGSVVGLGLDDPGRPPRAAVLVDEQLPEEFPGHHPGVPVEEGARQSGSHAGAERYRVGTATAIALDLPDRAPRKDRLHAGSRQRVPRGRAEAPGAGHGRRPPQLLPRHPCRSRKRHRAHPCRLPAAGAAGGHLARPPGAEDPHRPPEGGAGGRAPAHRGLDRHHHRARGPRRREPHLHHLPVPGPGREARATGSSSTTACSSSR